MIPTPCNPGCREETADVPDAPDDGEARALERWQLEIEKADIDEEERNDSTN
jgi:hypothetical protein